MPADDLFGGPSAPPPEGEQDGTAESAESDGLTLELEEGRRVDATLAVEAASGRHVPLDPARLAASIERARVAGGGAERADLGAEVADVVRLTLRARADAGVGRVTRPARLGELIERVLIELGAVDTARAYIVARDRRERSRVAREAGGAAEGPDAGALPMVRGVGGTEPFRARRIVGALIEEAGLLPDQAEAVAERVLETLRGCGLRSVGTGLVRELVSNELVALGFADALKRHEAIGLPRHDLHQMDQRSRAGETPLALARPWQAAGERRFGPSVAGALLERWALEDLLTDALAEAHRAADLHVVGLGAPDRTLVRSVPARLVAECGPGDVDADAAGAFGAQVGRVAAETECGLLLDEVEPFLRASAEGSGIGAWLAALGAAAAGAAVPVDLVLTGRVEGEAAGARASLVKARASQPTAPGAPRLFMDLDGLRETLLAPGGAGSEAVANACEGLLADGSLVPVWCDVENARWAGPGLVRHDGSSESLALDGAVALNLPRIARRVGPWREDEFLARLHGVVELALDALDERLAFVRRCRATHGEVLCDRPAATLVPVGIYEALRILGDGLARAEVGARMLGFLADAAARGGAARGIEVRMSSTLGATASARFARGDAALGVARQPRLFGDLPLPEEDFGPSYRVQTGHLAQGGGGGAESLERLAARVSALAGLLRTTAAGELLPDGVSQAPGGAAAEGSRGHQGDGTAGQARESAGPGGSLLLDSLLAKRPRLAAWSRFETLRRFRDSNTSRVVETTLF